MHELYDILGTAVPRTDTISSQVPMRVFNDRAEMVSAWEKENPTLHRTLCNVKYVPHLYRGGFVVPGYGYSIERIGRYVSANNAGNPFLVE